jgi:GTP-binding protein HflX
MLSDTVGFVRDLPHDLIASFKATLEEATHADLLLIVLDVADPAAELHYETVITTLDDLDADARRTEGPDYNPPERLLLLNKSDLLPDNRELLIWQANVKHSIPICALPATDAAPVRGRAELIARVSDAARGPIQQLELTIPLSDSRTISILENRAEILDRRYDDGVAHLKVRIGRRQLDRLRSAGSRFQIVGEATTTPAWRA